MTTRRGLPPGIFILILVLASWPVSPAVPGAGGGRASQEDPEALSPAVMEKRFFDLLNMERAARKMTILHESPELVRLARRHSADMAARNFLTHQSSTGKSLTERLIDAGILYTEDGENVARSGALAPDVIHAGFMSSPGHRANILNPNFEEVGIGISPGNGNTYFVTEDFIARPGPGREAPLRTTVSRIPK